MYLDRPDGTVERLGDRPTDDPRPYGSTNLAHTNEIVRASRVLIGKDSRLETKVESLIGPFGPAYQYAAPAIRHAPVYTTGRATSAADPAERTYSQGKFTGLAPALEIMLDSDDTLITPGISWPHLIPTDALEHARRLLFPADKADRLLGLPSLQPRSHHDGSAGGGRGAGGAAGSVRGRGAIVVGMTTSP
ncbi:hypothetical protein [Pseudonocardia spinosispora]|uniref:hypothetical protein n=1 Tax=Pseudonocardia spinosispora TaxID=103441 RepID=UPI00048F2FBB|nr:hypothetical protein [Pseudonocardia spinosispora]